MKGSIHEHAMFCLHIYPGERGEHWLATRWALGHEPRNAPDSISLVKEVVYGRDERCLLEMRGWMSYFSIVSVCEVTSTLRNEAHLHFQRLDGDEFRY